MKKLIQPFAFQIIKFLIKTNFTALNLILCIVYRLLEPFYCVGKRYAIQVVDRHFQCYTGVTFTIIITIASFFSLVLYLFFPLFVRWQMTLFPKTPKNTNKETSFPHSVVPTMLFTLVSSTWKNQHYMYIIYKTLWFIAHFWTKPQACCANSRGAKYDGHFI